MNNNIIKNLQLTIAVFYIVTVGIIIHLLENANYRLSFVLFVLSIIACLVLLYIVEVQVCKIFKRMRYMEDLAEQTNTNCGWLINQIDTMHSLICGDLVGTWQDRATQVIEKLKEDKKGKGNGY